MNNSIYHLVLENRPGEFMVVDIAVLLNDFRRISYEMIENIDAFTIKYDEEELYELIKQSNLVPEKYLFGKLHIINEKKYRFPIMYKDNKFNLTEFFMDNIDDKIIMNKFLNIFNKYASSSFNDMKKAVHNKNIKLITFIFSSISYINQRNVYFYIYNELLNN